MDQITYGSNSVMNWINYGLDSVWIRKNVNRIAYGFNMDMNIEYGYAYGSDALSKIGPEFG